MIVIRFFNTITLEIGLEYTYRLCEHFTICESLANDLNSHLIINDSLVSKRSFINKLYRKTCETP